MTNPFEIKAGPFQPTWESLRTYRCPDWFRDAKFGIWAHWGPQCVPMYGDWYARNMYREGSTQYRHHWRMYGHPSKHGYKDIIPLWKAENFDPDALMDLYVKAGAKYFVAQAVHHDNFDNWDSKHHRWNAVNMGPRKNIVGLFEGAARKRGLPFGLTEHLATAFSWFATNKLSDKTGPFAGVPYDGNDPEFADLYLPNGEYTNEGDAPEVWYARHVGWYEEWFRRMKDLIDQHHPDLIYSDGGLPAEHLGLKIVAHLYNDSAERRQGVNQAVYTQKDRSPDIHTIAVLDSERGVEKDILAFPWQTDTSVGDWYYNVRDSYKPPHHIIEMLIDTVSKNGNLLMNFNLLPDGTLDEESIYILDCIGEWLRINGEGIYETRPWRVAGEGPTSGEGGAFKEKPLEWTSEDFRFTRKGDAVYAFLMRWPEDGVARIRALAEPDAEQVEEATLLGWDGKITVTQPPEGLFVELPAKEMIGGYPHCIKIGLRG